MKTYAIKFPTIKKNCGDCVTETRTHECLHVDYDWKGHGRPVYTEATCPIVKRLEVLVPVNLSPEVSIPALVKRYAPDVLGPVTLRSLQRAAIDEEVSRASVED